MIVEFDQHVAVVDHGRDHAVRVERPVFRRVEVAPVPVQDPARVVDLLLVQRQSHLHAAGRMGEIVKFEHRFPPEGRFGGPLHASGLSFSRQAFGRGAAAESARQTRSGVAGMSIGLAPCRTSASATALTMAGSAPVTPASPQPLTPRTLVVAGTGWNARSKAGTSSARGRP